MTLHALLMGWLIVSIGFALLFAPQMRPATRGATSNRPPGHTRGSVIQFKGRAP